MAFYVKFHKSLGELGQKYRTEQAKVLKWVHQSFGGIKEVKVMSRELFFLHNYNESYKRATVMQRKESLMQVLPRPVLETIGICSILITMVVQIAMGADIVQFVPTLSLFAVTAFWLMPAFNRITAQMSSIMFTKASVNAVYEDLEEAEQLLKKKTTENNNLVKF